MNTLKSPLKRFSVAGMALCIALLSYVQIDAFNAVKEAKAISANPENIYTMYIGMPKSELDQNFSNIKGWKVTNESNYFNIEREYSSWDTIKAGSSLTQMSFVLFDNTNHIRGVTNRFNMDSLRYATEIYETMFEILKNNYGTPERSIYQAANSRSTSWIHGNHKYILNLATIFDYNHKVRYYTVDFHVYPHR